MRSVVIGNRSTTSAAASQSYRYYQTMTLPATDTVKAPKVLPLGFSSIDTISSPALGVSRSHYCPCLCTTSSSRKSIQLYVHIITIAGNTAARSRIVRPLCALCVACTYCYYIKRSTRRSPVKTQRGSAARGKGIGLYSCSTSSLLRNRIYIIKGTVVPRRV